MKDKMVKLEDILRLLHAIADSNAIGDIYGKDAILLVDEILIALYGRGENE